MRSKGVIVGKNSALCLCFTLHKNFTEQIQYLISAYGAISWSEVANVA